MKLNVALSVEIRQLLHALQRTGPTNMLDWTKLRVLVSDIRQCAAIRITSYTLLFVFLGVG